jgi:hypothetical protein
VMRVGGSDETVPVLLQSEDRMITGCFSDRPTAKRLAQRLFEPVRVYGSGRWARDSEGVWTLLEFKIESFDALSGDALDSAVKHLRTIETEWGDDSYGELRIIRDGPPRQPRKRHGGA